MVISGQSGLILIPLLQCYNAMLQPTARYIEAVCLIVSIVSIVNIHLRHTIDVSMLYYALIYWYVSNLILAFHALCFDM